jgi:RNA polymerase sigma factor (sigma-70 family)
MAARPVNRVVQFLRRAAPEARTGDEELLRRFAADRDEAAFTALVERHGPMVWGVCRRTLHNHHDAEDAFQATFLVLARKAGSIGRRELLANWLHGVAYNAARKARAAAIRRSRRECQVVDLPEPEARPTEPGIDAESLLDHELSRLPDRYRAVLVLCDLQGKTRKEAAAELGVPEGTVAGRLARARALLARRLGRSDGAGLLAVAPGVPAAVISATVTSVTGGAISARIATLTREVLTAMFLTRIKTTMVVVLLAIVLAAGTGLFFSASRAGDPQASPAAPEKENEKEGAVRTDATDLAWVYFFNDALADEKFTGKTVRVDGAVTQVRRTGRLRDGQYWLVMVTGLEGNSLPVWMEFVDSRKELAALEPGQHVTVEGKCEGRRPPLNDPQAREAVLLRGCKFIKIDPVPEKRPPMPGLPQAK